MICELAFAPAQRRAAQVGAQAVENAGILRRWRFGADSAEAAQEMGGGRRFLL